MREYASVMIIQSVYVQKSPIFMCVERLYVCKRVIVIIFSLEKGKGHCNIHAFNMLHRYSRNCRIVQ